MPSYTRERLDATTMVRHNGMYFVAGGRTYLLYELHVCPARTFSPQHHDCTLISFYGNTATHRAADTLFRFTSTARGYRRDCKGDGEIIPREVVQHDRARGWVPIVLRATRVTGRRMSSWWIFDAPAYTDARKAKTTCTFNGDTKDASRLPLRSTLLLRI